MKRIYILTITSPDGKPCGTIELDTDAYVRDVLSNGFNTSKWPLNLHGEIVLAVRQDVQSLTTNINNQYNITCCECGHHAGHTECEVTATSPTVCETCHDELLEEVETSNLPPAGTHGDW